MTLRTSIRPAPGRPSAACSAAAPGVGRLARPVLGRALDGPSVAPPTAAQQNRQSASGAARQQRLPLEVAARPIPQVARDLLADAGRGLGRAIRADQPPDRYAAAHLAALRGAAAVLATKARPGRSRSASAWALLSKLAPEFSEWAAFFAAGSSKRQAADAGIAQFISAREADDMVRQCAAFLDLVEAAM